MARFGPSAETFPVSWGIQYLEPGTPQSGGRQRHAGKHGEPYSFHQERWFGLGYGKTVLGNSAGISVNTVKTPLEFLPYSHSFVLMNDGSLLAFGSNGSYRAGLSIETNILTPQLVFESGVQAVSGSENHSLFVKTDGSLWASGFNQNGKVEREGRGKHTHDKDRGFWGGGGFRDDIIPCTGRPTGASMSSVAIQADNLACVRNAFALPRPLRSRQLNPFGLLTVGKVRAFWSLVCSLVLKGHAHFVAWSC